MSKSPKIRVTNGSIVTIDQIKSVDDLSTVMSAFSKLINAKRGPSMGRLSTAVGDLSASVFQKEGGDYEGDGADEIAKVLIATLVIANCIGLNGDDITSAVHKRLEYDAGARITALVNKSFAKSGLAAD